MEQGVTITPTTEVTKKILRKAVREMMTFARKPGKGVEVGSLRVAMWGIPQKDHRSPSVSFRRFTTSTAYYTGHRTDEAVDVFQFLVRDPPGESEDVSAAIM
jgi:hypothetical protein